MDGCFRIVPGYVKIDGEWYAITVEGGMISGVVRADRMAEAVQWGRDREDAMRAILELDSREREEDERSQQKRDGSEEERPQQEGGETEKKKSS